MKRDWLTWFLLAFLIATVAFCMPARAAEADVLQYVAAVADKNAENLSRLREDVAKLKADSDWNTWLLRGIVAAGAGGGAWAVKKRKSEE